MPGGAGPVEPRRRRTVTAGFVLVLLLAGVVAALTPVVAVSLVDYIYNRAVPGEVYQPAQGSVESGASVTVLHVELLRLDELGREVTFRVAGNHLCNACGAQSRVVFFSLPPEGVVRTGQPPSAAMLFPETPEQVTGELRLPIYGDLIAYPFDSYAIRLGVVL